MDQQHNQCSHDDHIMHVIVYRTDLNILSSQLFLNVCSEFICHVCVVLLSLTLRPVCSAPGSGNLQAANHLEESIAMKPGFRQAAEHFSMA